MKLAAKLTTVLLLGVLSVIVVAELILLRHENERMNEEMRAQATQLAGTMSDVISQLWSVANESTAIAAVENINRSSSSWSVRLVYLDVGRSPEHAPLSPTVIGRPLTAVYSERYCDAQGQEHLCTYAQLALATAPTAAIEVAEPISHPNRNSLFFARHALVLMGATTLLGAVLAVALGSAWIGQPLRRLIEKTRRIGAGDLTGPLKLDRNDEFGELAKAINSMCEQLQTAQGKIALEAGARVAALEQLRHADRLRTVGRLAAGIAHELGTPLNVVSGRAGLIASGRLSQEEVRQSAVTIKNEADRITTIIRQLLDFARRNTPQRKTMDLNEVVRQTLELLRPIAQKRHCTLEVISQLPSLMLDVDAGQLQQVLTNLIVNAFEAMPHGGPVEIVVTRQTVTPPQGTDWASGPYARVDVTDRGEGISPEILDQIFEPFFTTKQVGEGTGLGLSIAYGIIQEHGGWIDVHSELGKGSRFSVYLPCEVAACKAES
ncbi:MAG: sensor histidine kinase [Pirellulaceae bacterium]